VVSSRSVKPAWPESSSGLPGSVSSVERREPAPRVPARALGIGALLASAGLIASFAALGLNSIAVARIEGAGGAGLVALSTQVVVIAVFVAGIGLRTSIAYRVGAGLWSPGSAVVGALRASLGLGLIGAGLGFGAYLQLRNSAMSEFSPGMAATLMAALPFALVWWIVPAIPLACELFERYALLTVTAPISVLMICPLGALFGGSTGLVIGFAAGYVLGGSVTGLWALGFSRTDKARGGPEEGVQAAGAFGLRAWVNDLFQFINVRPDLFILSAYYGAADAGVYAVAVSITSLVWILSQPLASVVLPRTASLKSAGTVEPRVATSEPHVAAVRHAVLVCILAAAGVILVLAVAPLVWGRGFERIPEIGLILVPGVALLGIARVMVAAFTGRGAANHALLVGLVSFPLTLIAFLLVIPDHGSTGAAVVSCISYFAVSLLSALLFFRTTRAGIADSLVPRTTDLQDYVRLARRVRRELLSSGG
jgi:O-antigen/teichoic acid export membrane protein